MAFCINCGQELAEGAKFCASCGNAVDASQNGAKEQRKTVYDGELHKTLKDTSNAKWQAPYIPENV